MRDPNRIKPVIELLERAWTLNPDLRLGQLVVNAALKAGADDPFYVEDDLVRDALERLARLEREK